MDEKTVPLNSDQRETSKCQEGSAKRMDDEYVRNGSANVFCAVEALAGRYFNQLTATKSGKELGIFLGELERSYPEAQKVQLILDNFSSHTIKSVIAAYGEAEGNRIWKRFEVNYTPKHASWLNQGEIAIGMYSRQCLGGSRIGDIQTLTKKTKAWNKYINRKKVKIQWNFTKEDARESFDYNEKINWSDH